MAVFWDVAPCRLVQVYRRFGGANCRRHHSTASQKKGVFKIKIFVTAVQSLVNSKTRLNELLVELFVKFLVLRSSFVTSLVAVFVCCMYTVNSPHGEGTEVT
jgi:hypothetical protein